MATHDTTRTADACFIGPIIAMLLAVVLLGEALTRRKVVSLALGFIGTLIVLRPAAGIEAGLLWALASGALFACYLVAIRSGRVVVLGEAALRSAQVATLLDGGQIKAEMHVPGHDDRSSPCM